MFQKLIRILLLCGAGAVLTACSKPTPEPAQTDSAAPGSNTEADAGPSVGRDDEIPTFQVSLRCEYGQIFAEWTLPAEFEDLEQELVLYDFIQVLDAGNSVYEEFASYPVSYSSQNISKYVAWHYQETGIDTDNFLPSVAACVNVYDSGKLLRSVMSYSLPVRDFFPAETGPVIGEELPLEAVTALEWSGSGSSMESNFLFSLDLEEEPAVLYASYSDAGGSKEKEIPLDEESLRPFLELLPAGTLKRARAQDPDLEILDAGDDFFRISWQEIRDCDRSWYRFVLSDEDAEKLRDLFHRLVNYKPF